ncbi:MAG TPA: hypothetical protein VFL83_14285 [Anaeromyxobacter sp.]|nr:hypothetical protein [Anaeromyxobacter sp.]
MRRSLAAALALALLAPAGAGARGPSTPEERKKAVETTRKLEKEPLARSSMESRKWLFRWIVEIPDVNVTSCPGPLDVLREDEDDAFGQMLYLQSVFGMAAFLVENPKKKDDWVAVQTAGVESVLRAYDAMRRADSELRWKELDRLEKARKEGRLAAIVQKEMARCGSPDEMGPAPRDAI